MNTWRRGIIITEKVFCPASDIPSASSPSAEMTEEEVAMEMEAVEAVYGDEAVIVDSYPPHLHLHIKPRTAEISSQQVLILLKIETLRIEDCQISVFGFVGVLGRSYKSFKAEGDAKVLIFMFFFFVISFIVI